MRADFMMPAMMAPMTTRMATTTTGPATTQAPQATQAPAARELCCCYYAFNTLIMHGSGLQAADDQNVRNNFRSKCKKRKRKKKKKKEKKDKSK